MTSGDPPQSVAASSSDESGVVRFEAFSAWFGLDFGVAEPYVFSVEAGWTGLTNSNYGATRQGQAMGLSTISGPLNFFTLSAKVGWRL